MELLNGLNFTKARIIKNVIMLCMVFFIIFTAYFCLTMLQSTINHDEGIGVACLAIFYAFYCVSSVLFPKYIIQKLGSKRTLVISMCCYLPNIAANLYPHWSLMVPTSVLNGIAAALLWGSQCNYLNDISHFYAFLEEKENKENFEPSVHYNTGIANHISVNHKQKNGTKIHNPISNGSSSKNDESDLPTDDLSNDPLHNTSEGTKSTSDKYSYLVVESVMLPPIPQIFEAPILKYDSTPSHHKTVQAITARFFGIFGMAYLSTHIWSNVMSYFVLKNDNAHSNVTLSTNCICGAQYCNEKSDCFMHNLQEISWETRYVLTGICIGLCAASVLLIMLGLDPLNDQKENVRFSIEMLMATYRHSKNKLQILLIPISYNVGMMQGFYAGEFTASYVGCAWGTYHVSLVTICFGGACAVSSCVSGFLVKRLGRIPIFLLAASVGFAAQILLLTWNPTAENPTLFFVIAGLWGASLGAFWSQVKALYGLLFKEDEAAAFGTYHMWLSLGYCLSVAYSNYLCTYVQIYLTMLVLILGMIGYLWLEYIAKRQIKQL